MKAIRPTVLLIVVFFLYLIIESRPVIHVLVMR